MLLPMQDENVYISARRLHKASLVAPSLLYLLGPLLYLSSNQYEKHHRLFLLNTRNNYSL